MNIRQRQLGLFFAAVVLALVGVSALVGAFTVPVEVSVNKVTPPEARLVSSQGSEPQTDAAALPKLGELVRVTVRQLNQPLHATNTTQNVALPPATVSLPLKLIGTAEEAGESRAVFQRNDGSTVVGPAGMTIKDPSGDITIIAVELGEVTVEHAGRRHTLEAPKLPGGVTP
jgi:hypothetical protein